MKRSAVTYTLVPACLTLFGGASFAQTAPSAAPTVRVDELQEVVVEGTRDTGLVNQGVIPRTANEAVRYEVIGRDQIERSGASSLQDLLSRQIPQSGNVGTDTQRALQGQANQINGITTMTSTLDLRGFGSNQTLILVNGRRLYGSESSGPDISRIPLSAVERIEVSPSSGSAIYGANAMAGVVNIVLRKDFVGTTTEAYFGRASGGAEEKRLALTNGASFNEGRTTVTTFLEYSNNESLLLGERGYYNRLLELYPEGSPLYPARIISTFIGPRGALVRAPASGGLGIPGNPDASYAAIPVGSTGVGLTPSSFSATAGVANVSDYSLSRRIVAPASESASLFTTLEHAILENNRLGAYLEASYRWADNSAGDYQARQSAFGLSATNPMNPFRNDVTPGFVGSAVNLRVLPLDVPNARNNSEQNSYRLVAGLKGEFEALGERTFKWSVDGSWDRNETEAENIRYNTLLNNAAANGLYNPLKDYSVAPMLSAAELDALRINATFKSHPEVMATNWRINGELFDAWGGKAMMSLGTEYRREYYYNSATYQYGSYADLPAAHGVPAFSKSPDSLTRTTRDAYAGYMEINVPLVGPGNRKPLLHSLDVSAAIRYEKYEDFDAASPPMVAVKWAPVRDLALRGQFSEGFQPPTQAQLNGAPFVSTSTNSQNAYVDPLRPGLPNSDAIQVTSSLGNPNLDPETSDTWDAGIILTPRWTPGLTINVSYFRYDKKGQPAVMTLAEAAMNEELVTRGANLPGDPAGVPGPIIAITRPWVNVSRLFSDGIDYSVDYQFDTALGTFGIRAQATEVRRWIRQFTPTSREVDSVGNLGISGLGPGVLEWRGNASLSWARGGWDAAWTARYVDEYVYNPMGTGVVASSIEHDVLVNYAFSGGEGWKSLLSNTRLSVGVRNVFDEEPGFVVDSLTSWYSSLNDPRQRFFYTTLRKSF